MLLYHITITSLKSGSYIELKNNAGEHEMLSMVGLFSHVNNKTLMPKEATLIINYFICFIYHLLNSETSINFMRMSHL